MIMQMPALSSRTHLLPIRLCPQPPLHIIIGGRGRAPLLTKQAGSLQLYRQLRGQHGHMLTELLNCQSTESGVAFAAIRLELRAAQKTTELYNFAMDYYCSSSNRGFLLAGGSAVAHQSEASA